jgi:hypothetical protein
MFIRHRAFICIKDVKDYPISLIKFSSWQKITNMEGYTLKYLLVKKHDQRHEKIQKATLPWLFAIEKKIVLCYFL